MSVAGRPLVDGSLQVQVSAAPRRKRSNMLHLCATAKILTSKTVKPDDNAGPQVKVLVNNLQQLLLALVGRAVGEQGDGQRVGHSDCIRHLERAAEIFQCVTGNLIRVYLPLRPLYGRIHGAWTRTQQLTLNLFYLHQDPPAQSGLHQRLRHPACSIGGWAVHLCVVLPWESPAPVRSPATVSVNDDLPTCDSSVALAVTKICMKPGRQQHCWSLDNITAMPMPSPAAHQSQSVRWAAGSKWCSRLGTLKGPRPWWPAPLGPSSAPPGSHRRRAAPRLPRCGPSRGPQFHSFGHTEP